MSEKMTEEIEIELDDDLYEQLKSEAERKNLSIEELINEIILKELDLLEAELDAE